MHWVSGLQHHFRASSWEVLKVQNILWECKELSTLCSTGQDCCWDILTAGGLEVFLAPTQTVELICFLLLLTIETLATATDKAHFGQHLS